MAFVSEFISPDDVARYDILSIDRKFLIGGTNARDWVIDREREIYLRNVAHGGGVSLKSAIKHSGHFIGAVNC